jgi:hypothetical protein
VPGYGAPEVVPVIGSAKPLSVLGEHGRHHRQAVTLGRRKQTPAISAIDTAILSGGYWEYNGRSGGGVASVDLM